MTTNDCLRNWEKNLLSRHQLTKPDGRALYKYRLTEEEFSELTSILRQQSEKLSGNLSQINKQLTCFPALFVLYAAEWWRRNFDGGAWAWQPICDDIGAKNKTWRQLEREKCVDQGLKDWKRKIKYTEGLRFIGAVAVEGGFPVRLLAEARGRIGQLLGQVLKQANVATQDDILPWIESLKDKLPKSYQKQEIYALLAETAWIVLELKKEAKLTSSVDAIAVLDQKSATGGKNFLCRLKIIMHKS